MKFRIHLAAVTLLSGLTAPAFAADPQNITSGHRYYEKICAKCHEAGVGPNLKGRGLPPEYFAAIARNGFNAMPAFRVTYQQLYDYLQDNNIPLMLSFSAPSAIAGPLGNTMDRGVGYTPMASTS